MPEVRCTSRSDPISLSVRTAWIGLVAVAGVGPRSARRRFSQRLVLWTVVVMAAPLAACSSDDTLLPALLADPMASYEADGIVLVDSLEQAEGRELLSGKPIHARVDRTYQIGDQSKTEQVLNEAASYAEAGGWRVEPGGIDPTLGYGGAKDLGPGGARLGISLVAQDPLHDPDGPRALRITLRFGTASVGNTTTSIAGGS